MKGDEPQLREFFGLAGFDPSRDLRELVLAIYSRPGMADLPSPHACPITQEVTRRGSSWR